MSAKPKKPAKASPSQRLAAQRPRAKASPSPAREEVVAAPPAALAPPPSVVDIASSRPHKVRTRFQVVENRGLPEVAPDGSLVTVFHVKLVAVFEGQPVHGGLDYVQGNADNRIFGPGRPEAELVMKIRSAAVAAVYNPGLVFHQDHTEILPSA